MRFLAMPKQNKTPEPELEVPEPKPKEKRPPSSPVRSITIVVLLLGIGLFTYSLIADRLTPYTDQATVQAYVVRVAPDVSGRIMSVNVIDNQIAMTNEVLFAIDSERYQIAVDIAEAKLATAGQNIGASTAALAAAEARLAEAEAKLVNIREQTARIFEMVKKGHYPKAKGDQAQASLDAAIADVDRAKAEVEQARQNLGPQGADNPQIRQAQAELRSAQRDLTDTVVRAPSDGVVTNLQLTSGQFVGAGQSVMTFIDADVIWIESEFRENSIENLAVGSAVDIALDIRPGRVYPGKIESVGWGVNSRTIDPATGLPTIRNDSGWVREAQRFAVRIQFDPDSRPKGILLGSQANVVVYTGQSSLTDAIGRIWIFMVAYMSYLG
jgi:multidrug resistance efflux pump